jgi:hypothetical protein
VPQVSALVSSDAPSFPPDFEAEGAVTVNRNKRRNKRKKRNAGIKAKEAAKRVDEQFLEDAWVKAVTDYCMYEPTPSPDVTAKMTRVTRDVTVEYALCSADISAAGRLFKVRD